MTSETASAAREAEQVARVELWRQVMTMGKHCDMPDEPMADALTAYRDAVAARVRGELLASGTVRPSGPPRPSGDTHA